MSFAKSTLINGEQIIYKTSLRPEAIMTPPFICLMIAFWSLFEGNYTHAKSWILITGAVSLFAWFKYKTSEFVVTNKRVLVKHGILKRRSLEIFLSKIEGIALEEGLLNRKAGHLVVCGSGGTKEVLKDIRNPLEFRQQVQIQIDQMQVLRA